jgi:uncharacterized protein involved in exopolysaccharide biosynthesis
MDEKQQYEEINLLELIRVILRRKKFIFCFAIGAALVVFGFTLLMPNLYEAKAVIVPAEHGRDVSSTAGSLGGMASQFGLSLGSSSQAEEIVAHLSSNYIREMVIRKYSLIPLFLREKVLRKYKPIPAFISPATDLKDKTENQQMWVALRFLDDAITINNKDKEGVIEVIMEFKDPKIAMDIAKYFLAETNDRMSNDAKRVANRNRKYLESIVDKTSDPLIKMNVYNQIAQQIQTEMAAEAKEDFALKIIDPPREADRKTRPLRAIMGIGTFVAALFVAIFLALLKEFINKSDQARAMVEAEKLNLKQAVQFLKRKRESRHKAENSTNQQEEC